MKKKWTDYLSEEVYVRLCECRTIKADIPELVETYVDMGFHEDEVRSWYDWEDE